MEEINQSPRKTVSIRTSLLRTLVFLIIAISVTVLAVMFVGARSAIRGLSGQLISQASDHAEDAMNHFFHSIEGVVETSRAWWEAGLLDYEQPEDLEQLNAIFMPVLDQYRQITSMMVVHGEGFEYLLFRDLRGGDDYEWYNRIVWAERGPDAGFEAFWTRDGEPFRKGPLPEEARSYDPRTRPFYTEPVPGEIHWTDPYYFFITKDAGLTAAAKWVDPDSRRTRLVAFDLLLMDLSGFTSEFRPSPNGKVFVMHGDRSILGLPFDDRWNTPETVRGILRNPAERAGGRTRVDRSATLLTAGDLELPSVASAVEHWRSTEGGGGNEEVFRFSSAGESWWAGFRPFQLGNQQLWIGVVVPERDFLQEARRQHALVLGICAVALLGAVMLASLTARRYGRPLEALARQTEQVRKLNLVQEVPVRSQLREINQLAEANTQMMTALDSFAKYVPLDLVRQLLHRGEVAKIGGKTETLTVLFTDIEGFTNLAEGMRPDDLTLHMADYFSAMLSILHDEEATVDKFIGDAIVAFWGAPEPNDRHAVFGVRAVVRCRDLLRERNSDWERRGLPPLRTRFGLSTGEAVVGNVGAPDRLNYTVLGDTVNLASRLEALNSRYQTEILAAESVVAEAFDVFLWREVDRVIVKGKEKPIRIYEPLCAMEDTTEELQALARDYARAFDAYAKGAFSEAGKILSAQLKANPDDGPSALLLQRCRDYQERPPDPDWNGVTRFATK